MTDQQRMEHGQWMVEDREQEESESSSPRVLRLTLKRKWFDMIASGEKKEEYRNPGKWILSRLEGKEYDRVEFKNGYGDVPTIEVEYLGWSYSFGRKEWGGGSDQGKPFATIHLGRILKRNNKKQRAMTPANLFALPLSVEYDETGGYDCMSSAYHINDGNGDMVFTIDVKDIEPDRKNCDYGESVKAHQIAEWIISCANKP